MAVASVRLAYPKTCPSARDWSLRIVSRMTMRGAAVGVVRRPATAWRASMGVGAAWMVATSLAAVVGAQGKRASARTTSQICCTRAGDTSGSTCSATTGRALGMRFKEILVSGGSAAGVVAFRAAGRGPHPTMIPAVMSSDARTRAPGRAPVSTCGSPGGAVRTWMAAPVCGWSFCAGEEESRGEATRMVLLYTRSVFVV